MKLRTEQKKNIQHLMQSTRLILVITLCGHRSHVVLYTLYYYWVMKATREKKKINGIYLYDRKEKEKK